MGSRLTLGRCLGLLSVCATGLALGAGGDGEPAWEARADGLLAGLHAPDWERRVEARDGILAFYGELQGGLAAGEKGADSRAYGRLVDGLIALVAEKRQKYEGLDRKLLAVQLLGEMKAAEAVDVLLDNLMFKPPGDSTEPHFAATYPCLGALINIGQPSVDGIMRRLDEHYEDLEITFLSYIAHDVMGPQAGLHRFEDELRRVQQERENLQAIVSKLTRLSVPR